MQYLLALLALPIVGGLLWVSAKKSDRDTVDEKMFNLPKPELPGVTEDRPDQPAQEEVGHMLPTSQHDGARTTVDGINYLAHGRQWWAVVRGNNCPKEGLRSESGRSVCAATKAFTPTGGGGTHFQFVKVPDCNKEQAACVFGFPWSGKRCYMAKGGRCDS
jgi:hypothetical protein